MGFEFDYRFEELEIRPLPQTSGVTVTGLAVLATGHATIACDKDQWEVREICLDTDSKSAPHFYLESGNPFYVAIETILREEHASDVAESASVEGHVWDDPSDEHRHTSINYRCMRQ